MLREFREFINRGNLVEIAVAFVIGLAFAEVVAALTNRIVSPLIGMIADLESLQSVGTFGPIDEATGLPTGSVGAFIEAFLNFLIVAFVMFLVVKGYNAMRSRMEEQGEEPEQPGEDVVLLREIRDSLARS
jgi:large conductance mechanosensitive channel